MLHKSWTGQQFAVTLNYDKCPIITNRSTVLLKRRSRYRSPIIVFSMLILNDVNNSLKVMMFENVYSLLADHTATQYDRLLASSCCPSVCLSVTLCILTLRVGVQGQRLHQRVPSRHVPICSFRHFFCRMHSHKTHCKQESLAIAKTTAWCASIYGCPEKFRESSQTPPATFPANL